MDSRDGRGWSSNPEPDGATPLSEDEKDGLRLSWIATRGDLNAAEAANIAAALRAPRWMGLGTEKLLDDLTLRNLHRHMFGDVWKWAGRYRTSEKNIGCDPAQISVRVRDLCENAKYWFADRTRTTEAGCRFHHQLVAIHPFANGNGRHARAATDLLLASVQAEPFTWGRAEIVNGGDTRHAYIAALRAADNGDPEALMRFVRS